MPGWLWHALLNSGYWLCAPISARYFDSNPPAADFKLISQQRNPAVCNQAIDPHINLATHTSYALPRPLVQSIKANCDIKFCGSINQRLAFTYQINMAWSTLIVHMCLKLHCYMAWLRTQLTRPDPSTQTRSRAVIDWTANLTSAFTVIAADWAVNPTSSLLSNYWSKPRWWIQTSNSLKYKVKAVIPILAHNPSAALISN